MAPLVIKFVDDAFRENDVKVLDELLDHAPDFFETHFKLLFKVAHKHGDHFVKTLKSYYSKTTISLHEIDSFIKSLK